MKNNFHRQPDHLLFLKPGSMGDVLHALPVATEIHSAWPGTRITWIIDPRWAPLLENNPAIAGTHLFPRSDFRGPLGILRFLGWCRRLRELEADAVLDLQCLLRSGLMARFSNAPRIWGLSDAREGAGFFYTENITVQKDEHSVQRYLRALPAMGISLPKKPEWILPHPQPCTAIPDQRPFVVLHPFSRGAGKSLDSKCVDVFIQTFRTYSDALCVLVGVGDYDHNHGDGFLNLLNRTSLTELISILRRASFLASVDSGPMHLAAALGTPLLSIHTWSDPRRVGPFSEEAWIWQGGEIRRQNLTAAPLAEKPFTPQHAAESARLVAAQISGKS
ncbi:MAG: glycosyltransferase family 9 protein [bacterium]